MSNTATAIEILEPEQWASVQTSTHILFYRTRYDSCPENPMTADENNGRIVSFGSRHINYENPENYIDKDGNWNLPKNAIPLSYFEHGSSLWMVKDGPIPAGVEFQWDGVRMAGFWEPNAQAMENIGETTDLQKSLVEYCQTVLNEYNAYCNGDIYGYEIEKYVLKHDEDGEIIESQDYYQENHDDLANDSCYGFIGYDGIKEELQSLVSWYLKD